MTLHDIQIVFGDTALEVRRFREEHGFPVTYSANHVSIDIRGNYPDENNHFIIVVKNVHTREHELTITLIAESYSLPPAVVFNEKQSLLTLSHSSEILFIDTKAKRILNRLDISYPIYYFFFFEKIGGFVVVHELGIIACDLQGTPLWKWSSHEVVTGTNRLDDRMHVDVFDEIRYDIDLKTGEILSST